MGIQTGKIMQTQDHNPGGQTPNPIASCPASETHDGITCGPKSSCHPISPASLPVAHKASLFATSTSCSRPSVEVTQWLWYLPHEAFFISQSSTSQHHIFLSWGLLCRDFYHVVHLSASLAFRKLGKNFIESFILASSMPIQL